jgi:hypothetical protein
MLARWRSHGAAAGLCHSLLAAVRHLQAMSVQELIERASDPGTTRPWSRPGCPGAAEVVQGEFHWHEHHEQDEFFFVLDGLFGIELEVAETAELGPRQAFCVPAGMLPRPVIPVRSAVVVTEQAGVVATGTDGSPARSPRENAAQSWLQPGLSALLGSAPAVAR